MVISIRSGDRDGVSALRREAEMNKAPPLNRTTTPIFNLIGTFCLDIATLFG
jgi:hypothetical protein